MKKLKKVVVMLLLICITSSQCLVAEAAKKSESKYTVTVNKSVYTMKKGKTVQLKAKLSKSAKKKKIVWTSSNKKVATVSSKGKVTAKKNGKATITAKIKGTKVKSTCKIVVGTPVKSIQLNKKSVILEEGQTYRLKATASPKKATNKNVIYKSGKKSIATVSSKGIITAKKAGKVKITVTAADGTGKSATCTVTVKRAKIPVAADIMADKVTLDVSEISLIPSEVKKINASVSPENTTNKTLTWNSTNSEVVTVANDGTITARSEGVATITAVTSNGVSASCSVKVAYKGDVSNQSELKQVLASKMVTDITYTSNAVEDIVIPFGDYSTKTLTINAPNADFTNNGQFSKVIINAIAQNTYVENSNNVIYFNAKQGHVIVGEQGIATINMNHAGNQHLELESLGYINDLNVTGNTSLNIKGKNAVPVTLGAGAAGSSITTSVELNISAQASWDMTVLPGGENTKASINNNSNMPSISGVGCIPILVEDKNDIINVPAQMREDLDINQVVTVEGNVQQYYLEDTAETGVKGVKNTGAESAEIYLIRYSSSNSNLNENNCNEYLNGTSAIVATDVDGDYMISDVKIGNYWMIVKKSDYKTVVKNLTITSNNSQGYACTKTALLSNEIAECKNAPSISGTVIDGLTGNSVNVSGLTVKLRTGNGNVLGDAIQTVVTDEEGRYEFTNIPAGIYTVEVLDLRQNLPIDATMYNSAEIDLIVAQGYLATDGYNCVVNPKMHTITGQGQVQFTLTWGTEESGASSDIDSHLLGPTLNGNTFHVYYENETYYENDDTLMADLDVDDTDYEGPEHTTIYQEVNGIYRFYIHNFSDDEPESDMLSKSGVQVRVTIGSNAYTYNCPNQVGNLWYVCDYNATTHTIIPKNEMIKFTGNTSEIGMTEAEFAARHLNDIKEEAKDKVEDVNRDLTMFSDNAAKTSYSNRVSELEGEITSADTVEKANTIIDGLAKIQKELKEASRNPIINTDNLKDVSYEIDATYDQESDSCIEKRKVAYCSLFSKNVNNFSVAAADEEQMVTKEAGTDEYDYVIKVDDKTTGLSYRLYVRMITNAAEQEILEEVEDCERILAGFEEAGDIADIRAKLATVKKDAALVKDEDSYNEIKTTLDNISEQCDEIDSKFRINSVKIADYQCDDDYDWWTTVSSEYDDNDNWLGSISVLKIEPYTAIADDVILSKLILNFDDSEISYSTGASDREEYQRIIKVTDGTNTKKMYLDIDKE